MPTLEPKFQAEIDQLQKEVEVRLRKWPRSVEKTWITLQALQALFHKVDGAKDQIGSLERRLDKEFYRGYCKAISDVLNLDIVGNDENLTTAIYPLIMELGDKVYAELDP